MKKRVVFLYVMLFLPLIAHSRQIVLNLEKNNFFESEHIRLSVTVLSNNGNRDSDYEGSVRLSSDDLLIQLRGKNPDGSLIDASLPEEIQVSRGINTNLMVFSWLGGTFKLSAFLLDDPLVEGEVHFTSTACREKILFSEVMYRPTYSNLSYIEVYNYSEEAVDLKGCEVRQNKNYSSWISSRLAYVSNSLILFPGQYALLTLKFDELVKIFPDIISCGGKYIDALVEPLDGSCNMILYSNGTAEDSLEYFYDWTEDRHSLERCAFDLDSFWHDYWQASMSGPSILLGHYGTPGRQNGNFIQSMEKAKSIQPELTVTEKVATRKEKRVECSFLSAGPGRAAVELCGPQGRKIRKLFPEQDVPAGERRDISFDASDEDGRFLSPGIYFIVLRIISEDTGSYKKIIKPVVVGW